MAVTGESEQCEDRGGVLSMLKLLIIFHKANVSNSVWQLFSMSVAQANKQACTMASMQLQVIVFILIVFRQIMSPFANTPADIWHCYNLKQTQKE